VPLLVGELCVVVGEELAAVRGGAEVWERGGWVGGAGGEGKKKKRMMNGSRVWSWDEGEI
jgi:hypothetical protein